MAKRTFAELVEQIKTYTGDRDDDETLSLMEDINDTLNNETDWQAKYNENDKAWRAKYKQRFETGNADEPDDQMNKKKNLLHLTNYSNKE